MHSSHVLDSFLQIGSVEAVRRTPDGKIEVYRSSENLVSNTTCIYLAFETDNII